MARKSRVLTDHDEIRSWAEERDAQPACVRGTGSEEDVGMIRLDFPGYSGETSLEPVEWDEWFEKFEENNLALLVEDQSAGGEQSNFNKIIGRETARAQGRKSPGRAAGRAEAAGTRRRSGSARRPSRAGRAAASRSKRAASARGSSRRSRSTRATGKKRAQATRSNSKSRSRRRAA